MCFGTLANGCESLGTARFGLRLFFQGASQTLSTLRRFESEALLERLLLIPFLRPDKVTI